MRRRDFRGGTAVALLATAMLIPAAIPASAQTLQFRFGTSSRPLSGQRYETMRRLAHYLDRVAEHAAREADDRSSGGGYYDDHGAYGERRGGSSSRALYDFATQAEAFHQRIDDYVSSPYDLPNEVLALERAAKRVERRIGRGGIDRHVASDWREVRDVLERMKQVLYGRNVGLPSGWNRYSGDYQPYLRFGNENFGFSIPLP
jgi:hypothetical protein